ncbi:hypothetical protein AB837_00361 [bacterium AB1]|nr:hypothetical protein AB837_00361 [bacterium AB1]
MFFNIDQVEDERFKEKSASLFIPFKKDILKEFHVSKKFYDHSSVYLFSINTKNVYIILFLLFVSLHFTGIFLSNYLNYTSFFEVSNKSK